MARKAVPDSFKVFPERLSSLMKEKNLRQQDLADFLGVKRQTVSLYMTGQSMPDAEQLKNIAVFFKVSSDWLLGLSDTKTSDADIRQVCEYTGLSEAAITALKRVSLQEMSNFWQNNPDPERHVYPSEGMSLLFSSPAFYEAVHSISKALSFKHSAWSEEEKSSSSRCIDRFKLRINASALGMAAVDASDATNFYVDEATRKLREAILDLIEITVPSN